MLAHPGKRETKSSTSAAASSAEEILRFLTTHPGAWVMEIARNIDFDPSVVMRALQALEEDEHVLSEKVGRERHFYIQFTPWERRFLPLLNAEESWSFIRHVASRPSLENQGEITQRLGLSKDAVQYNAKLLTDLEVFAQVSIPSERRPGIGYEIRWRNFWPRAVRLLAKLPPGLEEGARLREILKMRPTPP